MAINHNRESQYSFDQEGLAGRPDPAWRLHTYDAGGALDLHFSNLFDQNEDRAGERFDLSTGTPLDNSSYSGLENLHVFDISEVIRGDSEDLLGPVID